jgi:adenine deaminase
LFDVLRIASLNPVEHYGLPVGLLRKDDSADFIVANNLQDFDIHQTWIKGQLVAEDGKCLMKPVNIDPINRFEAQPVAVQDIARDYQGLVRVIGVQDGILVTPEERLLTTDADVLKMVVVNRYKVAPPAVAYVRGFGLRKGALASSVAHDSHNIVAVGADDESIVHAIDTVIASKGGLAVSVDGDAHLLELPVAGLMSALDANAVSARYSELSRLAIGLGSTLRAPFMTLSFMALLVIPQLKLSDKGLFDSTNFQFVNVEL